MAKIINIEDILIKEFAISKHDEEWTISLAYLLVDDSQKEWDTKRIQIKGSDLTALQRDKIGQILTALITKIKTIEGI